MTTGLYDVSLNQSSHYFLTCSDELLSVRKNMDFRKRWRILLRIFDSLCVVRNFGFYGRAPFLSENIGKIRAKKADLLRQADDIRKEESVKQVVCLKAL